MEMDEEHHLKKIAEDRQLKKEDEDRQLKQAAEDRRLKKAAENRQLKKEAEDRYVKQEAEEYQLKKADAEIQYLRARRDVDIIVHEQRRATEVQQNRVMEAGKNIDRINSFVGRISEGGPSDSLSAEEVQYYIDEIDSILGSGIGLTKYIVEGLLAKKEVILQRLAKIREEQTYRSISSIKEVIDLVPDKELQTKLLSRLGELERSAEAGKDSERQQTELQIEQSRVIFQIEAEERRAKTRLQYLERFLERESVATVLGGLLLFIITIALLISMIWQEPAREIIYNGFLILLGYFFGQSVGKAVVEKQKGAD